MPSDDTTVAPGRPIDERACGRCQKLFPGDPDLHPDAMPAWWVCDDCRTALFGP